MFAWLRRDVEGILADLNGVVKSLNDHAAQSSVDAAAERAVAESATQNAVYHEEQAAQAGRVADKLGELLK